MKSEIAKPFSSRDTQNLIFFDLLKESFKKIKTPLPKKIVALDIGAGEWSYAETLRNFLSKNSTKQKRSVHLTGIDPLGTAWKRKIETRLEKSKFTYLPIDLFSLDKKKKYDLIFLIHPWPTYRYKEHNLPFVSYERLFEKAFLHLKKGSLFVGISFGSPPEEQEIFDHFPKKFIINKFRYSKKKAQEMDYHLGKDTFSNSVVLIGKK